MKVTAEEWKMLFRTKPRVSAHSKRKIAVDKEEPGRTSSARTVVSPPRAQNIAPKLIAMARNLLIL
jgi:hypothetical protein